MPVLYIPLLYEPAIFCQSHFYTRREKVIMGGMGFIDGALFRRCVRSILKSAAAGLMTRQSRGSNLLHLGLGYIFISS